MPEIAPTHKLNSRLSLALAMLVGMLAGCGQSANWGTEWDGWIKEPGTKVITGKDNNGDATRVIELASGVTVSQTRHDGKIQEEAEDKSGDGAVKCSAGVFLLMKTALDVCSPNDNEDLKDQLDDAIDRIDDFIAANSVPPTTKAALKARTRENIAKAKASVSALPKPELRKICTSGDLGKMVHEMKKWPENRIPDDVTRLLSVSRPAVLNPCM